MPERLWIRKQCGVCLLIALPAPSLGSLRGMSRVLRRGLSRTASGGGKVLKRSGFKLNNTDSRIESARELDRSLMATEQQNLNLGSILVQHFERLAGARVVKIDEDVIHHERQRFVPAGVVGQVSQPNRQVQLFPRPGAQLIRCLAGPVAVQHGKLARLLERVLNTDISTCRHPLQQPADVEQQLGLVFPLEPLLDMQHDRL